MTNPVNVTADESRAMQFIQKDNVQAGQNISNAGAIGGMAADIGLSLLSVIPIGGAAVNTAKEGVKLAKTGVETAKAGLKTAKTAVDATKGTISTAKETLKAAKGAMGVARQGVQTAKASTLGFKVANKTLAYGKVGAGLVQSYGSGKAAAANNDGTGVAMAAMGATGSVTKTTISEVQQQQQSK